MNKLEKIGEKNNVLTWFELPARSLNRAKAFYERILDIQMTIKQDGEYRAAFFPYDPTIMQASSGRVTGTIIQMTEKADPLKDLSYNGVIVYLNASPSINLVLERVIDAGGKILEEKSRIPPGWIAKIKDTEGNIIGLFAEQ